MNRQRSPERRRVLAASPVWKVSPASSGSVAQARRHVAATLGDWALPILVDDAVLIASELVTNAVRHGTGTVWYALRQVVTPDGGTRVRLVVGDHGQGWDLAAEREAHDPELGTSGRGLDIVAALASAWGAAPAGTGHVVWAELQAAGVSGHATVSGPIPAPAREAVPEATPAVAV